MIYHITTRAEWQASTEAYSAASLATEGFIHCSTSAQITKVANAFYRDVPDLILLCINPDKLTAPLLWEAPAHPDGRPATAEETAEQFPHVYGAINHEAVPHVIDFPQNVDGTFSLPDDLPK